MLRESYRTFLRRCLTITVVLAPFILWFAFDQASKEWDKSFKQLIRLVSEERTDLLRQRDSPTSAESDHWDELFKQSNPVLLAAFFAVFILLLAILFMTMLNIFLLYLFFGLYLLARRAPRAAT